MNTWKSRDEDTALDKAIEDLFEEMSMRSGDSEEYSKLNDQLSKLYSLKEIDSKKRVSPDTLAMVLGNLLGIVLIVGHERMNVVTSKALNFVMKLR
jgi:hypothetical protein